MDYINKIAFYRNIRSEVPNQELARELAHTENKEGIKEISEYLYDKNKSVASDCLKVLYEIGYINPELIKDYAEEFLKLLESKNNRMVWGAMIALATIAELKADDIFSKINLLLTVIKKGTVITEVWGIKTLVHISKNNETYKRKILPVLIEYLEKCRSVDFATRVETVLPIMSGSEEKETLNKILNMKVSELSDAQTKKLKTVLNKFNKKNS